MELHLINTGSDNGSFSYKSFCGKTIAHISMKRWSDLEDAGQFKYNEDVTCEKCKVACLFYIFMQM